MAIIRVVLADDHPFVRTGIRNILQRDGGIEVIGEAGDGFQALQLIDHLNPDVLVLDMEMPGMKGFQVAKRLKEEGSALPILALSAHEDRQFILGMLENGAAGYLVKDEVPEMITRAVKGVARGEQGWVSRRIAARIAIWLHAEKPEEFHLARQDLMILHLLVRGRSNAEIAVKTNLHENEVEQHLRRIVRLVRNYFIYKGTPQNS